MCLETNIYWRIDSFATSSVLSSCSSSPHNSAWPTMEKCSVRDPGLSDRAVGGGIKWDWGCNVGDMLCHSSSSSFYFNHHCQSLTGWMDQLGQRNSESHQSDIISSTSSQLLLLLVLILILQSVTAIAFNIGQIEGIDVWIFITTFCTDTGFHSRMNRTELKPQHHTNYSQSWA